MPPVSPPPPPPSSSPSNPLPNNAQFQHLHHSLPLKRAVAASLRGSTPSTPFPSRKLLENQLHHNLTAASHHRAVSAPPGRQPKSTISARKLAASLWEHHETPISQGRPVNHALQQQAHSIEASPHIYLQQKAFPVSALESGFIRQTGKRADVSNASPQAITVIRPISGGNGTVQREADSGLSQANKTYGWLKQTQTLKHAVKLPGKFELAEPGDVTSPKYFVKVLDRIKTLEDQQSTNMSVVAGLRVELECARTRVQELEFAQKIARKEFDNLLNGFAEETTVLRSKEQERIKAAVLSMREELERESKAKRRIEMRNMKLSRELSRANKALRRAMEELEKERKSRELMEDVCDELAKEIGQDKAEVEDLKRVHAKVWEEVEEERKMLQMAEVWREERVQMKLEEARLELEERKQVVEALRSELEVFLMSRRSSEVEEGDDPGDLREARMLHDAAHYLQEQFNYQQPGALKDDAEQVNDYRSMQQAIEKQSNEETSRMQVEGDEQPEIILPEYDHSGLNLEYDAQPVREYRNMQGSSYKQLIKAISRMHLERGGQSLEYQFSHLESGGHVENEYANDRKAKMLQSAAQPLEGEFADQQLETGEAVLSDDDLSGSSLKDDTESVCDFRSMHLEYECNSHLESEGCILDD